nr:protein tipE [Leptinotarsa decemlineata]
MSVLGEKSQLTLISIAETAKFYTSLCLGTTAFLSVFAFLFLIPFVVDPAITSLMADYEPDPVTCMATQHIYAEGISNCSWSSCREGCTREATRCHQIYVNYSKLPFSQYRSSIVVRWDVADTRLLINTEGCGYPPSVNCSEFARQYGYQTAGTPFPCYYSRVYPEMQVVARYSWDDTLRHLILSITIPNLLFAASIGVLSYWYCPGCGRSCQKYMHHFPAEEEDFDENTY